MPHHRLVSASALSILGSVLLISGYAQAGISDIPEKFSEFLGTSQSVAELILAVCIFVSIGMLLAFARTPVIAIMLCLIMVQILLVAFGWLDTWTLMLTVVFTAGVFALRARDILSGGG